MCLLAQKVHTLQMRISDVRETYLEIFSGGATNQTQYDYFLDDNISESESVTSSDDE